jgi:hypothetical protein
MIAAGYAPNKLEFYEADMASADDMGDIIASIVLSRFRDARSFKSRNSVYQGKSTITLLREADYAMEKRFTDEEIANSQAAFGTPHTRYYGLSAAKAVAIANWKSELVAGDPGAIVNIVPTPNPRLTEESIKKIKDDVKRELVTKMIENGVADPRMLLDINNNRLHNTVKKFLDDKAKALRAIEQAKIVSSAMDAADRIEILLRDVVVEGGFREAYSRFSADQIKYGVAILRFPFWKKKIVLSSKQNLEGKPEREWRTVPTFATVSPWNFFPTNDADNISDCTAVMEYKELNKATLVGLAKDSRYDAEAIIEILEDYSYQSRGWLFPESSETVSENGEKAGYWGPEELVAVIYHEGYFTGRDLSKHGLTGYEDTELYSATVEVCCGRTIRLEVQDPEKASPRSYATTKYEDLGAGVWNAVGVPGILQNTQERINTMYRLFENNLDWALRPPLQVNKQALENSPDAMNIQPGGKYEINEMLGLGQTLDPIRAIRGPTSQFQIVYPLISQMLRQADAEVGVPDLADMSTFGRGSLGELSARVSQAVRRVRSAAFSEDTSMKAIWQVLFEYVIEENPKVVEGADLDMNYEGVVGLLAAEQERKAKMERLALTNQAVQAGAAPPEVAKFAYEDLLSDMGVPTTALGMQNPMVDNAIALATASGSVATAGGGVPQVPQLDGRSGAIANIPSAIAQPNGGSQIVPPTGI